MESPNLIEEIASVLHIDLCYICM